MDKAKKMITVAALMGVIIAIFSALIMILVYRNGLYPAGTDTMYHLYKGDVLYKEISKGNFYPLFDPMWYNGVEMLRYWAPLPVYFIALCQALAGGHLFQGYIIFVGLIFALGAVSWIVVGIRHRRLLLGFFMGLLWFFMPNNLLALFVEGNLPRALCMVILPLLISFIYGYLNEGEKHDLPRMMVAMFFITLCHTGFAGMIFLSVCFYLIIYAIAFKEKTAVRKVVIGMILAFMLTGIWSLASFVGGITSVNSEQVMQGYFQDALVSLNPFRRLTNGVSEFYFGLAAFITGIFGIIAGKKQARVGFWTGIIIFILTTGSMYRVLVKLPGSQFLWMLRFISIALCFILFSLLMWKTLKKGWLILVMCLLVADCLPSLQLIYGLNNGEKIEKRLAKMENDTLIAEAKEITNQRLALMDMSSLGAMACYMVSGGADGVAGTFGAGWQSAATAYNIVQLNQAAEDGYFLYLFDRMIELGTDTVVISKKALGISDYMVNRVTALAKAVGFLKVDENKDYLLYHMDSPSQFGVKTIYSAIAIGSSAPQMALTFPCLEETESNNLNDYTYEQLAQYDTIYIAGFVYDDRAAAEKMLLRLSEEGKRIIILADGIPAVESSGTPEFLGVQCFNINFTNGYPELVTKDGVLNCRPFHKDARDWKTVYINGLDKVWGTLSDLGNGLDFYGSKYNDNIIFVGLNLTYHYALTQDDTVGDLLSGAFSLDGGRLPDRKIYPIQVEYGKNSITIDSPEDNLNSTISYHDNFTSESKIESKNHLTVVDSGRTVIKLHYPYLWQGTLITLVTAILTVLFLRRLGDERKEMCYDMDNRTDSKNTTD